MHIDKATIIKKINTYSKPYLNCPAFSLKKILSNLNELPNTLNPAEDSNWFIIKGNVDPNNFKISKNGVLDSKGHSADEINTYNHNKYVESSKKSVIVKGIKWNLSGNHKGEDICDQYATQDLYGLGSGVYPQDKVPNRHYSCKCYLTSELYEGDELINRIKNKHKMVGNGKIPKKLLPKLTQHKSSCLGCISPVIVLLSMIILFLLLTG